MKLSTRVRYGTRALIDIAEHGVAGPVNLKDVARRQGISEQYLEQLILPLKGAGMVRSIRGARGGFILNKCPSDIRLIEVVEVLDGKIALTDCLHNREVCLRVDYCATRELWQEASDAMKKVLASVTLADLSRRQQEKLKHMKNFDGGGGD